MERDNFDGLCAYMASLWGRELSNLQRAGGWKLMHSLPSEAVENAVVAIAESGREQLPPWPLVYKTAQALAEAMRAKVPQLPQADVLSDQEHIAAMIRLRARETPEQRRRASRMTGETKDLPMQVRLRLAQELLVMRDVDAAGWDRLFDAAVEREFVVHPTLLRQGQDIHA